MARSTLLLTAVLVLVAVCSAQNVYVRLTVLTGSGCSDTKVTTRNVFTDACVPNPRVSGSYNKYTCNGVAPQISNCTDSNCNNCGSGPVALPTNCQPNTTSGTVYSYRYDCVNEDAKVQQGFMKLVRYRDSNCGTPVSSYVYADAGACFGAYGSSERVSCDSNDKVTYLSCTGSDSCSGCTQNTTITLDEGACSTSQNFRIYCSNSITKTAGSVLIALMLVVLIFA